ncbi:metal-sulfur cluster assembly factor [Acidipila sp. EB88]|uniref:metal-sulfur cluster assembly factor n=1 Tax=Acidipila sp. EB88 TaxID=2305226 RepID=UPI000F5D4F2D|nr:metal-sulfur cluster assembly factor [Acidipila sp. EB88]RRA47399.1 metal-sulfur cluster assembly factor [Acidipila sp. EB88]
MPLTEDDVRTALRDVNDPELPVNIVDLGLVYNVTVEPDPDAPGMLPRQKVHVVMSMTTQGCPAHAMIIEQVRNRLGGIQEISLCDVELVWEPAWTPDRISPEAQRKLGIAS